MSDNTNTPIEHLTYTAAVGKKVSGLDYGTGTSDEITVYVQVDVPVGTDPTSDEAQIAIRNAVNAGKARVGAALGIEVSINDDGEAVYGELPTMPAVTVAGSTKTKGTAPTTKSAPKVVDDGSVPAEPPHIDPEPRSAEEKANSKWAAARFAVAPNEFFDNRPVEGRRPHIKHKYYNRNTEHGAGWKGDLVGWIN